VFRVVWRVQGYGAFMVVWPQTGAAFQ
jgi:hypothetical protein